MTDVHSSPTALAVLGAEGRELLFEHARTANSFSSEPVDDETLREIHTLAKWPPTASNSNPLRFVFVRTRAGKRRLLPHMAEGNQAKTERAPVTAILAEDSEFHQHIPRLAPFKAELRDTLAENHAMREGMGRFNATLQAGYFLFAVRAVGLAAGPMAGFDKAGVDAEFFAHSSWRSILTVNLGKPGDDPWFERLPRFEFDEVVELS